jgi:hypothetical protein
MTLVAGGASFDENIVMKRAKKVGTLPEYIPNANLDKSMYNPLLGSYTYVEAISRALDVQRLGTDLSTFISKAYDKFGPGSNPYHDPEDPNFMWDFDRLFAPAADHGYINSTIPGASAVVSQSIWKALKDPNGGDIRHCLSTSTIQKYMPDYLSEDEDMLDATEYSTHSIRFTSSSPPPGLVTPSDDEFVDWDLFERIKREIPKVADRSPTPFPVNATAQLVHAELEAPIAHTESGEPVLKDKFEQIIKYAYEKGADDTLEAIRKSLASYTPDEDHDHMIPSIDTLPSNPRDNYHSHGSPIGLPVHVENKPSPSSSHDLPPYSPTAPSGESSSSGSHGNRSHRFNPYERK